MGERGSRHRRFRSRREPGRARREAGRGGGSSRPPDELGALDKDWGYGVHEWEDALDDFYDEHEYVNTDAKARSSELFILDDSKENSEHSWKVRQIIDDSDGDHDWAITGTVDLDTTQSSGEVVFFDYSVSN